MAGAGVRLFTAGSQLLASQVNTYLMDQVVCYFADSASRDAAFGGAGEPSLSPGRICYLFSDNKLYLYGNDNAWAEIGAQLDNLEVTTAKINDLAVTEGKLADSSVTSAKIVDGTIVNADINASAAIALTKLATGTVASVIVHNASGVPTATAISGDIAISSTGVASLNTASNPTFAGVTADLVRIGITAAGEIDTSSGNLTIDSAGGTTTIDDNVTITGNLTVNGSSVTSQNTSQGYTTTVTSAGTLTLTSTSTYLQYFTGSTTHTVVLPVTSTLQQGTGYEFHNNSTGVITINSSGGNSVFSVQPAQTARITCILVTGTTAASWDADVTGGTSSTGTGALVFASTPTLVTPNIGAATGTSLQTSGGISTTAGAVSAVGGSVTARTATTQDGVILTGRAGGTSTFGVTLTPTTLTASRTITLPDTTGSVVTTGDTGTVTSTMISDGTIVNADINASAAIELGKLANISIDRKTSNYTLVLTDANKLIEMDLTGTANTVSVPTNSVAFPIGTQITIIQYGTGKTQIVATTPGTTTIRHTPGSYLRDRFSSATLIKRDTEEWYLIGDLSAT